MRSPCGRQLSLACALLAIACTAQDDGSSPLACQLSDQCVVAYRDRGRSYDYETVKAFCECEGEPSDTCVGERGVFSQGECPSGAVAKCTFDSAQERFFYQGFSGFTYRTHQDVQALYTACQLVSGTLVVLSPLCVDDADCDDGISCNGAETCREQTVCTGFCTETECIAGETTCPDGMSCDGLNDVCFEP